MFRSLGVQLRLWDRDVRADAREPRLFLHAIFWERGRVGMNANGDALEAGHREYRLGVALGKVKVEIEEVKVDSIVSERSTFCIRTVRVL